MKLYRRNSKYMSDFQDISIYRQKSANIATYMIRAAVSYFVKTTIQQLGFLRIKKANHSVARFSFYYFFFTGIQSSI
ncbi:hypothetical protein [Bacillus wiedmannii]|uniref:hypothetical protein n=1 Tax=Bacillus wiedmannii TaxID=1890302 RepID=UPI003CF35DE9